MLPFVFSFHLSFVKHFIVTSFHQSFVKQFCVCAVSTRVWEWWRGGDGHAAAQQSVQQAKGALPVWKQAQHQTLREEGTLHCCT